MPFSPSPSHMIFRCFLDIHCPIRLVFTYALPPPTPFPMNYFCLPFYPYPPSITSQKLFLPKTFPLILSFPLCCLFMCNHFTHPPFHGLYFYPSPFHGPLFSPFLAPGTPCICTALFVAPLLMFPSFPQLEIWNVNYCRNLRNYFCLWRKKVLEIRNFAFFSTLNVKNMQKEAPLDVLFVINFTPLTEFVTFKALSSNFVARWNISIIVYKSGNWVKKDNG